AAESSLRNLATSSSSQLWVAINSARHSRMTSIRSRRVSGRIGRTLSGQADHLSLGALEQGEQRTHLTTQLGNLPTQGSGGSSRSVRSRWRSSTKASPIALSDASSRQSPNSTNDSPELSSASWSSMVTYQDTF